MRCSVTTPKEPSLTALAVGHPHLGLVEVSTQEDLTISGKRLVDRIPSVNLGGGDKQNGITSQTSTLKSCSRQFLESSQGGREVPELDFRTHLTSFLTTSSSVGAKKLRQAFLSTRRPRV